MLELRLGPRSAVSACVFGGAAGDGTGAGAGTSAGAGADAGALLEMGVEQEEGGASRAVTVKVEGAKHVPSVVVR